MKLTIQYHTEKPAVELEVEEIAPGLCMGPNPAYGECKHRPKYALFHTISTMIIRAVKTKKAARELAGLLIPIMDWNRPKEQFTRDEMRAACKITREFE